MALQQRLALYREIETLRERPLISYVTSPRPNAGGTMAADVIPEILDQLGHIGPDSKKVDFLIVSQGGDPTVAWRVMSLLRERFQHVAILVPQSAFSAATLMALGADEIVMHANGNLGPTDPQIESVRKNDKTGQQEKTQFGAEDLAAFLKFTRDEVGLTDQEHLRELFVNFCNEVGHVQIGFAARAVGLSISLGERLLKLHMTKGEDERKIRQIVETLNKNFFVHGYPVGRVEAKSIGLPIAPSNTALEGLIWRVWSDIESELNAREAFHPLGVIQANPAVMQLLFAPVPMINAPLGLQVQAQVNAIDIPPVPVDNLKYAFLESTRLCSQFTSSGIILATRTPDLQVKVNLVWITQRWTQVPLS